MNRATTSILGWGIYLVAIGVTFLFLPNFALGLLGFSPTGEVWIRVLAMLAAILGYYHIRAARSGLTAFYPWTIHGRAFAVLCIVAFVVLNLAPPMLLLFAAFDLLGGLWTWWALRAA